MEVHHDLRKFITETVVAQSCGVLSSGREARGDISRRHMHRQPVEGTDRRIDNVKRLTPGVGIESFMKFDSDQRAAEALQVAETEVGVVVRVDRSTTGVRAAGRTYRPTDTAIDVGLTA
jgi:hypothetical protein